MSTESQEQANTTRLHMAGRLAIQSMVVMGALAVGYQLNSSDSALQPLVPDARAGVITIQSFPAAPNAQTEFPEDAASTTAVDDGNREEAETSPAPSPDTT